MRACRRRRTRSGRRASRRPGSGRSRRRGSALPSSSPRKPSGRDGNGLRADQLADPRRRRRPRSAARARRGRGCGTGSAAADRQVRVAEHEAADDVGAAGDRLQRHRPDLLARPSRTAQSCRIEPVESTARSAPRVELAGAASSRCPRRAAGRRAGAEHGHALLGDDPPERVRARRAARRRARSRRRRRAPRAASSTSSRPRRSGRTACPRARSPCSRCSLRCSSSVPPAPCTMHFGGPVVPEENRMNSGWLNGKRSHPSASARAGE